MSAQADDARDKVYKCTALDDTQKARMFLLINTEADKALPVFTGVPDSLIGPIVSTYLESVTPDAGADAAKDHDKQVLMSLARQVEELQFERNVSASTTTTDRTLGQKWSAEANYAKDLLTGIRELSVWEYSEAAKNAKKQLNSTQQEPLRQKAKKRSAQSLNSGNTGSRLQDLIQHEHIALHKTKHMQPQLMELLRGIHSFQKAEVQLHDTHARDPIQQPPGQVHCSLLASDLRRWTSMVVPIEFKLDDSEELVALGQLVSRVRHTLQQQPARQRVFAVVITMQSVEVFRFTRLSGMAMKLQRSGAQALSFDARCIGFQWLVRIIHGTLTQLGYKSPHLPPLLQVGHHEITNIGFIGQGRKAEGSFVYRVDCGDEQAILKLNHTDRETKVLQELGTVNNVVQLLGHGMVPSFEGQAWHTVLVRPFGKLLSTEDPAHMYKQAAFDIATAIGGSFAKHIRHQDISPYNMVVYKERVFLTDWSAGRVSSGRHSPIEDMGKLTMTPLFGAISVLQGSEHTISSHLESLFYSLYYLALGCKLPDGKVFEMFPQCDLWWMTRLGAMMSKSPLHLDHIQDSELRYFMLQLHNVFFNWIEHLGCCQYRKDVTVDDVLKICRGGDVDSNECIL